jgi:hypothetical protein
VRDKGILGGEYRSYENADIRYYVPPVFFHTGIKEYGVCEYTPAIFFLVASDFPDNADSKYFSHEKYKFLHNREYLLHVCGNITAGLNNLLFRNREDFYDYMKQFEGFTVPDPTPAFPPEKQREKQEYQYPTVDSVQYQKIMDSIRNNMDSLWKEIYKGKEIKKKALKKTKNREEYNILTLQIENQRVDYDYAEEKYYVKFDVMASSNNPELYLYGT